MVRRSIVSALLFLALPACSGEVLVPGETSSSVTTAGGTGGSGTTGGVGGGGVGGSDPTGGVGGAGGAPACTETHEKLSIQLSTWDGKSLSCESGGGDYEFSASVEQASTSGFFVLDSCPPNADCAQQLSKLTLSASVLYTDIPQGTFVRVHVSIEPFMGGCAQRVQIKNLPTWGGQVNPYQSGEVLWFVGVDGGPEAFPDTPFQSTPVPLHCFPDDPMGCGGHDDYTWHFQATKNPSDPGVTVSMGETAYWSAELGGQFQNLILHNLRSYSIGACDGPVDLAYWAAHQYPLD